MTPREFINDIVMPNLEEFERDQTSQRHAMNAVLSADTLVAHIFWWCKNNKTIKEFEYIDPKTNTQKSALSDDLYRFKISTENNDYKVILDIAKALKHVELTKTPFVVGKAEKIAKSCGSPGAGYGSPHMGYGQAGALGMELVGVTLNDNTIRPVVPLVRGAIEFLEGKCTALGL